MLGKVGREHGEADRPYKESKMSKDNVVRFGEGGVKVQDVTAEDVRQLFGLPKVIEQRVVYGDSGDWRETVKHKALVDEANGKLFGIHSDQYRTVPHEEGILAVMEVVEKNPEFGPVEWTVRSHDEYKRMVATGRFVDVETEIRKGDLINPTVTYRNSYDGAWGEVVDFGAYRIVCSNGMMIGERIVRTSVPHLGDERPDQFLEQLENGMEQFSMQTDLWKTWLDKALTLPAVEESLEVLQLTGKEQAEVLEEVGDGDIDLWAYFNILTALVTHRMASLDRQVRTWNRLRTVTNRDWR